jgi:hypothetical protein
MKYRTRRPAYSFPSKTMMRLLSLFMLLAATMAFTSPQPLGIRNGASIQRFMFSAEDDTKKPALAAPLATMENAVSEAPRPETKSVVKDMNTGEVREVKWVDPAMAANTNPLNMNW